MARLVNDSTVFSDATGLASMKDQKPVRLVIPKFNDGKLLITKISGGVRPNFQLMYSLGSDVFINAFNQRLSMWTLSGLYIPSMCDNGKDFKGEPAFVDLYRRFNIRSGGVPLDMAFNGIVLVGFFVEIKIQDYTQKGIDGFSWEAAFLGRVNNFLEDPDPIVLADALAFGPDVPDPVRNGELEDNRQGTYFGDNPDMLTSNQSRPLEFDPNYLDNQEVDPYWDTDHRSKRPTTDGNSSHFYVGPSQEDLDYWEMRDELDAAEREQAKNRARQKIANETARREYDAVKEGREKALAQAQAAAKSTGTSVETGASKNYPLVDMSGISTRIYEAKDER